MAWRIGTNVVRGEIDNRLPGIVRGVLYLEGLRNPVQLELEGDAYPDLAGRHLTFRNLMPRPMANLDGLSALQTGEIGTFTASRMVRIPTIPDEEVTRCIEKDVAIPTRWSESLYLEWFSENGRVLIEGAGYACQLSQPKWRLSDEKHQWLLHLKNQAASRFELDDPDDGDSDDLGQPLAMREEETNPFGRGTLGVCEGQFHPTVQRISQGLLNLIFEARRHRLHGDEAIANQPLEGMIDAVAEGTVRAARALANGVTWGRTEEIVVGLKRARWSLAVAAENASLANHMGAADPEWLKAVRLELADQRNEIRELITEYQDRDKFEGAPPGSSPSSESPPAPGAEPQPGGATHE